MTPPAPDPNIDQLRQLADQYREARAAKDHARMKLDAYIQELKNSGYPYRALAKHSGLAQGTIQNIVAKDTSDRQR